MQRRKVFDLYNVSTAKKLKPITYNEIERNTRLFKEKIELFNVEAAEGTVDLKIKIDKAFDVNDKVTKKFFDKFKKVHYKLQNAITGIPSPDDVSWYASVLLNRIMFIYFLQKHKVIQDDANFLLNKFDETSMRGEDYYRDFLLPLFFLGFARKDGDPLKQVFVKKYGPIRYLNGGLFYPHHIENKYSTPKAEIVDGVKVSPVSNPLEPDISVDADMLKEILEFLNGYTWYLDNRPMKEEKDINPDVLGYIFEKYINQKELGAYYTKEDITDYISKNTIIPFILDKLRSKGFSAPDPAPLITNNQDIKQAIADYIEGVDDYEQLKYLYNDVLLPLSVLDPAVGSGAFLFAALNIILPLYRKTAFKLKSFRGKKKDEWLETFCKTLEAHSEEYFLTKQVILNNLYGVDIVEEATEICKLRLFLQLASHLPNIQHIEPLPDIDFNIYAGNSLVGGLSWDDLEANYSMKLFNKTGEKIDLEEIKQEIQKVTEKKRQYRIVQQGVDDEATLKAMKDEIQYLENRLNGELIDIGISNPFHWFIEFNDIISRGGFDVVIGNPPYVEYTEVKDKYEVKGYRTITSNNLYAFLMERSEKIASKLNYSSFIVPVSILCTDRMEYIQKYLLENYNVLVCSSFAERPSKLFEGAERNVSILIYFRRININSKKLFSTGYMKWYSEERGELFESLKYIDITGLNSSCVIPKIGSQTEISIWKKVKKVNKYISNFVVSHPTQYRIVYRNSGGRYWKIITDFTPHFTINGKSLVSSRETYLYSTSEILKDCIIAVLNSSIYFWWYIQNSDARTNNPSHLKKFPINLEKISLKELSLLSKELMRDYRRKSQIKTKTQRTGFTEYAEYYPRLSKSIIDKIDTLLAKHYGFTKEELNFIINYDLRFRMGDEGEED